MKKSNNFPAPQCSEEHCWTKFGSREGHTDVCAGHWGGVGGLSRRAEKAHFQGTSSAKSLRKKNKKRVFENAFFVPRQRYDALASVLLAKLKKRYAKM